MGLIPLQDGEVAKEKAPIPNDPEILTNNIKSLGYFLDADVIGITEEKTYTWYSHDKEGKEIGRASCRERV